MRAFHSNTCLSVLLIRSFACEGVQLLGSSSCVLWEGDASCAPLHLLRLPCACFAFSLLLLPLHLAFFISREIISLSS